MARALRSSRYQTPARVTNRGRGRIYTCPLFTETISRGGEVLTQTLCTVEFIDLGGRTEVVLTDQGIGAEVHRGGWSRALDQLARVVSSASATSS